MQSDWRLVWCLWLMGLGAAAQYGKISVVFDRLPEMFPGAGAGVAWAVSLVGFVGILFGVVAGVLAARIGLRRALLGGCLAAAALSLYQATAPAFVPFLFSRVAEGVAHLAIVVAAPTLIAQVTAPRGRGFALTLWGTFFGVAFAVLAWAGLPLVARFGVPALFLAHGLYMAAMSAILWPLLPPDGVPAVAARTDPVAAHLAVYRSPRIAAPALGWLFYTLVFLSTLTLLPLHVAEGLRGPVQGAMPLISIVASMTLGVWLLGRMSSVRVIEAGFLTGAVLLVLLAIWPGQPVVCLVFAAALGLVQGASFAAVPELNPSGADQARANGGLAQMGNLGNTLGTPVFAALLAWPGYGAMVLCAALVLGCGFVVHRWLARRRLSGAN